MCIQNFVRRLSLSALALSLAAAVPLVSRAAVLDVYYSSLATGRDGGPQDGVFDAIVAPGMAGVSNNGWTSMRTAFEFTLSALPTNAVINAATVTMTVGWVDGTRQVALHGYAGDGAVTLADFALDGLMGVRTLSPSSTPAIAQHLSFDVSDFLKGLASGDRTFVGFNLREDPANEPNYEVLYFDTRPSYYAPRLSVDYTTRAAPEPSSLLLLAAGVMALAAWRVTSGGPREAA